MSIPWGKIGSWLKRVGLPWLGKKAIEVAAKKLSEKKAKEQAVEADLAFAARV